MSDFVPPPEHVEFVCAACRRQNNYARMRATCFVEVRNDEVVLNPEATKRGAPIMVLEPRCKRHVTKFQVPIDYEVGKLRCWEENQKRLVESIMES